MSCFLCFWLTLRPEIFGELSFLYLPPRFRTQKYRWGCVGVAWCIYIFMASSAVLQRTFNSLLVLFLPVLVIDTFCCLSILKTLQKPPPGHRKVRNKGEGKRETHKNASRAVRTEEGTQERGRRAGDGKEEKGEKAERSETQATGERNAMKKRAFITVVIIQAVLTLNYVPFIIILPMDGLVQEHTLKCQFVAVSLAAAACGSYLQPLLYLHRLGRLPCMMPRDT